MSVGVWKEKQAHQQPLKSDDAFTTFEVDRILLPEKTTSGTCAGLTRATVAIVTGLLVGLIVIQVSARLLRAVPAATHDDTDDLFKMTMQFRGVDDIDVEQHVTSTTSDNYVIYHVIKPHESAWILDDFERSLQLMKIVSEEESVCYVTYLNRTLSTPPEAYGSQKPASDVERKRFQTTFYVDEVLIDDVAQLGTRAVSLCADTPTFWIHPVTPTASSIYSDTHHRDKRNVKKCMTSCCLMVCCCNQRFLQWQTDEKFNCHNVCKGCTPQAKMSVQQVC